MAHIIEISDLSAPELAPYTQLTHAQLRSQRDPEKGIFMLRAARSSPVPSKQAASSLLLDRIQTPPRTDTAPPPSVGQHPHLYRPAGCIGPSDRL